MTDESSNRPERMKPAGPVTHPLPHDLSQPLDAPPTMAKGIKETKEFYEFMSAVRDAALKHLADGVQYTDALKIAMDEQIQATARIGLEGVAEIGAELSDATLDEQRELSHLGVDFVFDTREALAAASDAVNQSAT